MAVEDDGVARGAEEPVGVVGMRADPLAGRKQRRVRVVERPEGVAGSIEAPITGARERQQSPFVRPFGLGVEGGDEFGGSHAPAYPAGDKGPCPPASLRRTRRVAASHAVAGLNTLLWGPPLRSRTACPGLMMRLAIRDSAW